MNDVGVLDLFALFQAVGSELQLHRHALNQADPYNGNHGDHMVEIFKLAAQVVQEKRNDDLADAMLYAGQRLEHLGDNGSARVYARGLVQLAGQFRNYQVNLDDLVQYVQGALSEDKEKPEQQVSRSGDILKALVSGLSSWGQTESNPESEARPLSMGTLFEFGMAYLQAKQRGGNRAEVFTDAAVSVTPLSNVPHRLQSGKLVLQSLLKAIVDQPAA